MVKPQQSDFNALLYRMSQTKKRKITLCFGTCCHVGSDNEVFRMAAIFAWAFDLCSVQVRNIKERTDFQFLERTQNTKDSTGKFRILLYDVGRDFAKCRARHGVFVNMIRYHLFTKRSRWVCLEFLLHRWLCVVMEWACHCHSLRWISGNSVVMVDFLRQRQGNSMSLPARALGLQEGYSQERCFRCFFFMFSELLLNG